jgi:hypothetical protein
MCLLVRCATGSGNGDTGHVDCRCFCTGACRGRSQFEDVEWILPNLEDQMIDCPLRGAKNRAWDVSYRVDPGLQQLGGLRQMCNYGYNLDASFGR